TAAERRERNEPDPQLAQQRDDPRLEIALPQRVLALERRDRVDGMCATDRLLARFREAEESDLSLAHQIRHHADDILDRHGGIHAVLVEKIDAVSSDTAERAFDG